VSEVVRKYYDGCVEREWGRLERPYRRFELVSTLRLIDENFPPCGRVLRRPRRHDRAGGAVA
jgi:hypothetical protein